MELTHAVVCIGVGFVRRCGRAPTHGADITVQPRHGSRHGALLVIERVAERRRGDGVRASGQVVSVGFRFQSVVDRFGRRLSQFIIRVRSQDDFPVELIPGNLLAHLLQAPERIEIEPFVVLVDRIVHGLLYFRPRHVTREVMGIGGDLYSGRIKIRHRLDRLIIAVEIDRRGQPSVCFDAQHLALAAGALALHPVVRRAAQRIGRREGVRIVLRQPIVIVVIGDAQVIAFGRHRRIALVRVTVNGRSPDFVKYGRRVQRRLMRFECAARDDSRKHGTVHPVVLGERPLVGRSLLATLGHSEPTPPVV